MIKVFCSYSHKDEDIKEELLTHLHTLDGKIDFDFWTDKKILAGTRWNDEIQTALIEANVILILLSSDYLSSSYCMEKEAALALSRHRNQEAYVVPIIARAVQWQFTDFAEFQVLPKGGLPIMKWSTRDEGFLNIVNGLEPILTRIQNNLNKDTIKELSPKTRAEVMSDKLIILIEDEYKWSKKVKKILDSNGYRTDLYHDYDDDLFPRLRKDDYDLFIVDLTLGEEKPLDGEKHGVKLIKYVRAHRGSIPIIILTGSKNIEDAITGLRDLKVDNVILKQAWDTAGFLNSVREALNGTEKK